MCPHHRGKHRLSQRLVQLVLPELARTLLHLSGVLTAAALHVGLRTCVAEVARMMCIGLTLDCGHMVDGGPSLALYPPLQVLQEFHVITLRNFDTTGGRVDGRLAVLGNAYITEYSIAWGLRPADVDVEVYR